MWRKDDKIVKFGVLQMPLLISRKIWGVSSRNIRRFPHCVCSSNEPAAKGERTGKAAMTPMLMGSMSSKRLSGTRPEMENFYVKSEISWNYLHICLFCFEFECKQKLRDNRLAYSTLGLRKLRVNWAKLPFCLLDVGCHLGMPACDWSKFWPKPAWVQTESESHLWLAFWTLQCSALKSFLYFEFWVC